MSVFDKVSKSSFLVDTGADISVLPLSFLNLKPATKLPPARPGQRLRAANCSFIDTFGTKTLHLNLEGFTVSHSFRVAKVGQPILGADFFRKNSIVIDVPQNCLRLPSGEIVHSVPSQAQSTVAQTKSTYADILAEYPSIAVPRFDPASVPAHGVQHVVPTSGPPVFARARPLYAEKLKVAREEFDKMLALQIIRPSSSPWASPLHMVPKRQLETLRRFQEIEQRYL